MGGVRLVFLCGVYCTVGGSHARARFSEPSCKRDKGKVVHGGAFISDNIRNMTVSSRVYFPIEFGMGTGIRLVRTAQ